MLQSLRRLLQSSPIFNFNQVERDRWVARMAAQIPAGSAVLDVGAGSCPYRPLFSHCIYKAADFCNLDSAQLQDIGYGPIDYACDAAAIPVPDGSFDVVLCTELIEHVPDPVAVVREFARILKPGGTLLLTAPLGSALHQQPYHFYGGYTPYWYQKFLPESGFAQIVIEPNGGFFRHYGQESIRFASFHAPWRSEVPTLQRIALFPWWLVTLPWFAFIMPLLCHVLDPLDREKIFTVGYHVLARRTKSASTDHAQS